MLELYRASRDELIDTLLAQRDLIADQERELARQQAEIAMLRATIAQLTQRVGELVAATQAADPPGDDAAGGGRPAGVPGLKSAEPSARSPRPRKRRPHGFARRRMAPTHRQVHALARGPLCRLPLAGGTGQRRREVIEVVPVPAVVTEHVSLERRCPRCRQRWVPGPELGGVVCGQQRLGIGLVSRIAALREEARLPFATIQWDLRTLHGLSLRVGALVGAVARGAARAQPVGDGLRAASRASPCVNADETGWREAGRNGYAWTFGTPTQRDFVRGGRDKGVLAAALGDECAGVLVSDCYAVYTGYDGVHQYCWAHLLRAIHDLTVQHPRDAAVLGWADAVHDLDTRARAFTSPAPQARRRAQRACEGELLARCQPYLGATSAPTPRCRRIEQHLAARFVFVAAPQVPATNNAAERSRRHLGTSRKISGGTRSPTGSATKMALASLFGTWRAQGLDPLHQCRHLLAAPQV